MKLIHSKPHNAAELLSLTGQYSAGFCGCFVDFDRDASRPSLNRDAASVLASKAGGDIRYDQSVDGGFMQAVNPLLKRSPESLVA